MLAALRSPAVRRRGWRILERREQVRGMREWPVRGDLVACEGFVGAGAGGAGAGGGEGNEEEGVGDGVVVVPAVVAEGCVRAEREDGRGVMGFFVACFVRDREGDGEGDKDGEGPFVRDAEGRIVRGPDGIPTLKSTGRKVVDLEGLEGEVVEVRFGEGTDDDGPFERDAEGRIVRGADGMPRLKAGGRSDNENEDEDEDEEETNEEETDQEEDEDEWGGFDE